MSKQPTVSKVFDPTKLDAMSEPLAVRVEKLKSNTRTPIPLPAGEDGTTQGTNWSKDDVRGLEQWLVNEWSGGGLYAITVIDSSLPNPLKHSWEVWYNPHDYAEKVPPTLSSAAAERMLPTSTPSASPSQPQQVRSMGNYPSAFPNGLPGGLGAPQGQPQTVYVERAPQVQYLPQQQPFQQQQPQQPLASTLAAAAIDAERRRYEEQVKELQVQLTRAREEQLQIQHRQELERAEARMRAEQQAQNEKFSKLEQMIAQLATASSRPAVDPAIEALKEQNRLMVTQVAAEKSERENERREREAERREREMKDMITRQQEDTRRQIEMMNAQMAASAAAAANNKTDPMIMFMQENARQQIEAVKEQSRNQTAQMTQLQTYMMNPRDIMAMAKESSNGLDQATRSITNTYQSILEMQRSAVEQILQLNQGGGNETIQLIEKGLDRASSFAERFIGGKTKEAVSAQQSQAQLAQANAAAMQAQAQAMATQAQMQRQAAAQAPDSGLNGARIPAMAGPNGETQISQTSSAKPKTGNESWTTGPVPAVTPQSTVKRTMGHTDEEWFGPILPKVVELRDGVARFIESLQQIPHRLKKDGTVDGIEPEQAASVILQAAMIVMEQQIPIAAMIDLLGQGRVADFMDVLLPEAPQPYRDEVAQMLLKELSGGGDDDEDEDDEGEDDEAAAEAAPPAAPVTPVKPASRARA